MGMAHPRLLWTVVAPECPIPLGRPSEVPAVQRFEQGARTRVRHPRLMSNRPRVPEPPLPYPRSFRIANRSRALLHWPRGTFLPFVFVFFIILRGFVDARRTLVDKVPNPGGLSCDVTDASFITVHIMQGRLRPLQARPVKLGHPALYRSLRRQETMSAHRGLWAFCVLPTISTATSCLSGGKCLDL